MNDELPVGLLIAIYLGVLALGLIIQAVVCWVLMNCFTAVPAEHRKMEPSHVWFLMIPLFNVVWNFFVFPRLADSYRSWFDQKPDEGVTGDCGKQIGLIYSGCIAASLIPCVGFITGLVGLVMLIVYLIKANELRAKVLSSK